MAIETMVKMQDLPNLGKIFKQQLCSSRVALFQEVLAIVPSLVKGFWRKEKRIKVIIAERGCESLSHEIEELGERLNQQPPNQSHENRFSRCLISLEEHTGSAVSVFVKKEKAEIIIYHCPDNA